MITAYEQQVWKCGTAQFVFTFAQTRCNFPAGAATPCETIRGRQNERHFPGQANGACFVIQPHVHGGMHAFSLRTRIALACPITVVPLETTAGGWPLSYVDLLGVNTPKADRGHCHVRVLLSAMEQDGARCPWPWVLVPGNARGSGKHRSCTKRAAAGSGQIFQMSSLLQRFFFLTGGSDLVDIRLILIDCCV